MTSWLTTILIFLPVAGALLVWLVPMPAKSVGSIAALVSLVEIAVWIAAVEHFDFGSGELQLAQQRPWFHDLGVSYHVGQFGYSLWLVGLTVVCGAAACLYAWWVGRERPRAYFGLLLFLTGAVVGVFVAQDLLLFYAFFEAMLIPLYVLIGVWGGAARMRATITFVVYTVAGSLLMLAAIVVYGLQQGTFDLTRMAASSNDWLFLAFAGRGVGPPLRRDLEGGRVRLPPDRDPPVPGTDARLPGADPRARLDRARLRLAARVPRPGRTRRDRILIPGPTGADHVRRVLGQ